tara:strand:+ start:22015 stop:22776 length:762 start_codon:yes stop_codon:yes gene_type:complete
MIDKDINNQIINKFYLIKTLRLSGIEQMCIDAYLFNKIIKNNDKNIIFRFFEWDDNWVSIGKNQKIIPAEWMNLQKQKTIKLVKRPSGGGSVIHNNGITFSIIWNNPNLERKSSYKKINEWLIKSFSELNIKLFTGEEKYISIPTDCFSMRSKADLIDAKGLKRVGSAQLWRNGSLLNQTEILLDPSADLWEKVFQTDCPKLKTLEFNKEYIKTVLLSNFKRFFNIKGYKTLDLNSDELSNAYKEYNELFRIT